jgi:hypothetical protein
MASVKAEHTIGKVGMVADNRFWQKSRENEGRQLYSKSNGVDSNNTGNFLLAAVYKF